LLLRHLRGELRQLNTKRWLLLLLGAIPVATHACSSGNDANDAGPGDSTAQDSPADNSASDGGQPSDADAHVPLLDACVAIEGGLACDPAHIACGTTQCMAGSELCCIEREAGMMMMMMMQGQFTCDTDAMQCQGMMSQGTVAYCDEAANCPNEEVCCGFIGSNGGYATSCQPSCEGNAVQFCHGSAECASGTCVGQTCNGEYVETCGALLECPP
jgi:hypothetical protein